MFKTSLLFPFKGAAYVPAPVIKRREKYSIMSFFKFELALLHCPDQEF